MEAEPAHVERRLAAIMAADVVGFSGLMEADEGGTLTALRQLRTEVADPLIVEHSGRIVKLMGDGMLVEFASVVDAVSCAASIQKKLRRKQIEVVPGKPLMLRIGVNLGDVVVEGSDLLGDGVNVAARLEQLCEPGGILISGAAYDQLPGKVHLLIEDAGERRVKNIVRPIRTYKVRTAKSVDVVEPKRRMRPPLWLALAALAVVVGLSWYFVQPLLTQPVGGDAAGESVEAPQDSRTEAAVPPPPEEQAKTKETDFNIWGNVYALDTQGNITGWVADRRDADESMNVYLYVSGKDPDGIRPEFSGCIETNGRPEKVCGDFTYLGTMLASQYYDVPDDVPVDVQGKNHGFSFPVPDRFWDGEVHYIYAFVIPRERAFERDALLRGENPDNRHLIYLDGSPQPAYLKR